MNTQIQPNGKPVFEIDAHVVRRLNAGDGFKQQVEFTSSDLLIFRDDVFDPLLAEPYVDENFFAGIELENGTLLNVKRVGDEIIMSVQGAPIPARLTLDQAQMLSINLDMAADCFNVVSDLDDDDADFIEDGSAPTPDPDFIEDGAAPPPRPDFIAGTPAI